MRSSQLLAAIMALSSVTAASSSAFDDINALGDAMHMFFPRQDDNKQSSSKEEEKTSSKEEEKASSTEAPKETEKPSDESKETSKPTATKGDSKTTDKGTKTTSKPKVTNFGPDVQPGGVQMVTPNPIMGPQYYKVGEWVTLAWNYTSLSITPKHIDIMASCSVNQQTYTIAVNQTVEPTGKIFWDTGAYKKDHPNGPDFVTETYTLLIYDSESSVSATPRPGYLAPFNQFYFGMYQPKPAVSWEDWTCPNCLKNGAMSATEQSTLKILAITSATTMASLLYFSAAFGLW